MTPPFKRPRIISLRILLTVPFLLEIFAAVGLTGWLALRNGQQAVNDLAEQLQYEVSDRITQQVDGFLTTPTKINAFNAQSLRLGDLSIDDPIGLEQRFWQQIQVYTTLKHIYFGNEQLGYYVGAGRQQDGVTIKANENFQPGNLDLWMTDEQGQRTERIERTPDYDPRRRAWYQDAIAQAKPGWSEIYSFISDRQLGISATYPIFDDNGQPQGVLAVDYQLDGVSQFLASVPGTDNDTTFIIEPSGLLVASSTTEDPFILDERTDAEPERLLAVESTIPAIRLTVQALQAQGQDLATLAEPLQFVYHMDGEPQFVRVVPLKSETGLNWLIAVVIPESDFMAQIHANRQNTILLCLVALAIATGIGIWTSQRLSRPIFYLSQAAARIAGGNLQQKLRRSRIKELDTVATAFNQMSDQLEDSFRQMAEQRDSFARFVPVEYLEFLRRDSLVNVQLGEHVSRAMAIFFSDIRAFTTLVEQMHPKDAFRFINAYFGKVSPIIRNNQGFIVKYIGDGIMAAFPRHVDDAVEAAITQIAQIEQFNQENIITNQPSIRVGMAIHVGHVMVGILGEQGRFQGDAFSDHVNLAARLEGLTKLYGTSVLISESAKAQLSDQYQLRFLDRVAVKGRTEAIAIHEVLDAESPEQRDLKLKTQSNFIAAIAAYQAGELDKSQTIFEQIQDLNPSDQAVSLYLERIASLQTHGLRPDWDGVWRFTEK
ncbi:MAG: HAMP domain-containing protein [Spirulina sp. SIO3F2]|nr:HAMP domain-containing protein [Spirulina sp. SIO3F2]